MQDPSSLSFQGIKPEFPEQEQHLKCPRCDSTNTKFCYYNNYNLSQPRHFCKSCRRYWTKGGALRNIPVGGGTRKNSKRSGESTAKENSNCKRSAPSPSVPKVENLQAFDVGNGSFTSLLGDGVGLGGFIGGGGGGGGVHGGESGGNSGGGESFLDGSGGWPDLSIYTPGSNFPCD